MPKKAPPLALVETSAENVDKSTRKSTGGVTGNGFKPGPDHRRGNGPAPGSPNAGRPPEAWKAECEKMASRDDMLATARRVLKDKDHPAWLGAWKFVAEQAYGKAPQPSIVSGGQVIEVIVRNESKQERAG